MYFIATTNRAILSFVVLFPAITLGETSGFDYCKISSVHTMCAYKTISKNCVQYKTQSEKAVRRIMNDHNLARSKFAGGRKGFFVPDMMKLYWDQELADLSARWACQCKGSLDADRGVARFEVGQVVWTIMNKNNFTGWKDIWKYILKGGTGFFQRDYWGRMLSNYDPSDPLSLIYNPHIRFMGCTLAKYLIWSVEASSFAYTTTLVCNYGPLEESYEKYPKEDWPCRDCPNGNPCFTSFYLRGKFMPPNLPNERNLCIDPQLENQRPRSGKDCPVDSEDAARNLHLGARNLDPVLTGPGPEPGPGPWADTTPYIDYNGEPIESEYPPWAVPEDMLTTKPPKTTKRRGTKPTRPKDLTHTQTEYLKSTLPDSQTLTSTATSPTPYSDLTHFDLDWPSEMTERGSFDEEPGDYNEEPIKTSPMTIPPTSTSRTTKKASSAKPANISTTKPGEHDPSEEEYDYHGPMDLDGHVDYCELSCVVHVKHTLCTYEGTSPDCGHFTSLTNGMTEEDLLDLHNDFRNEFTEGKTKPPHPLASNMVRLKWSKSLRDIADMWLRQCKLGHDWCRDSILEDPATGKEKILRVSQNIGWEFYDLNETAPSHRDLFAKWKMQARNFTFESPLEFLSYTEEGRPKVDDFVQLIWARTHYVGCAYGSFVPPNSTKGTVMLVCNYAPLGKEVSKEIYIPGGPCSNCYSETLFQRGRCMLDYPSLCDTGTVPQLLEAFIVHLLISLILYTT